MLTAQQMVALSDAELEKLLLHGGLAELHADPAFGVNNMEVKSFIKSAVREIWLAACKVNSPIKLSTLSTALQSYQNISKPVFCDKGFRERLSSIFMAKGITDVVGEASAGKTQFCLQLLLDAITPIECNGLGKGAIYLHTEGEFPHKRWEQLKNFRQALLPKNTVLREDLLVIRRISSVEEMDDTLDLLRPLSRAKSASILIIDSIAAVVRGLSNERKQSVLYRWACSLQETSDDVGIPIFTTNQVADFIDDSTSATSASYVHPKSSLGLLKRHSSFTASGGRLVVPALGLRWTELVNARIALTRTFQHYDGPVQLSKTTNNTFFSYGDDHDPNTPASAADFEPSTKKRKLAEDESSQSSSNQKVTPQSWIDATVVIRKAKVLFSPVSEPCEISYFIDAAGLHSIS